MSLFSASSSAEWERLKKQIPISQLGGLSTLLFLCDKENAMSIVNNSKADIEVVENLRKKILEQLNESASTQDYLDALTKNTPILCADIGSTLPFRFCSLFSRTLRKIFPSVPPISKYRWLLPCNVASASLCIHTYKTLRSHNVNCDDLTFTALIIDSKRLNAETILEANASFYNLFSTRALSK